MLTPYDIDLPKQRVGNERDGAYIMIAPAGDEDILSFGVNDDVSFEREMAARGHRSFMYDHTIDGLPEENPKFQWRKQGICSDPAAIEHCLTLREHLAALPDLSNRLILKIDVEGHEWGVFWKVDQETLGRFDQILVECHWLGSLEQPGFLHNFVAALSNINAQFTLCHVHANNCAEMRFVAGFPVADVLELTFVKSNLVTSVPSQTIYPTSLNKGNRADRKDHPLLFFPFLPTMTNAAQLEEMASRIDADVEE